MQVREATESDIPAIVNLLKLSLGESLMPKSERYWRWKHQENPFGRSPILLCFEGHVLIGIRAFMQWQWLNKGKTYAAVRAVDTATHPDHQGKGIFRKLTLSLLDSCREKGIDFVFNTPNRKSKPGYLKMGWREAGKLPVALAIRRPGRIVQNLFANGNAREFQIEDENLKKILQHAQLPELIKVHQENSKHFVTNTSVPFLKWRYLDVPVVKYFAMAEELGNQLVSVVIARIKQSRIGRELRIADCFFNDSNSFIAFKKQLEENLKLWDIDFYTCSGLSNESTKIVGGLGLKAPMGPMVTIRPVNNLDLSNFEGFRNWSPSLGDLELF